ncbi:MAG: DUF4198 domain-containing protein [Pseudomonadales bacterium]|jgi:uncharacterized GH25 family protein|tara:strand:- start:148 stop:978 length:831 start_codon:yes stop_codon:yes gene_type:complete
MDFRKLTMAAIACSVVTAASPVLAHEMFLVAQEYETTSNSDQVMRLINGTFDKSENSIGRERMANVSIISDGSVTTPLEDAWFDDEVSSYLNYKVEDAGTYAVGVSTRPSVITMSAEDFTGYLVHEGLTDTLAAFESDNTLTEVSERYSKHVRAIVQVGDKRTDDFSQEFDYPVEIILDQNPYELRFGDEIGFRVLYQGKPAANQIARASYEGFHGHDDSGGHINAFNLRTDSDGRASFMLSNKAIWYISLIHMEKVDETDADYESNWATVTFEVD